jgi:hypothetical protein
MLVIPDFWEGRQAQITLPTASQRIATLTEVKALRLKHAQLPAEVPRPWLWVGGGGLLLIDRYVVALRRSLSAYSNPGKVTLPTGRSDNAREWANPALLVREMFEEILMVSEGNLLIPNLPDAAAVILPAAQSIGLTDHATRPVTWSAIAGPDCFTVNGVPFAGVWHVERQLGEVNYIQLFHWDLPLSELNSLTFYDSEWGLVNEVYQPLHREIILLDWRDLSQSRWPNGATCPIQETDLTAHCAYALSCLRE